MSDKGWLAAASVRRALLLFTFLDLWVLGRHRLVDVAPWRPLAGAEPGAGQSGTRAARDPDRRPTSQKSTDEGRCLRRSRLIARSTCRQSGR